MGRVTLFYNCSLLRDHQIVKYDLWVQNGRIIDPAGVEYACDEAVDCAGALISPGYIDLKLNGAFGVDFSDLPPGCRPQEEVERVAAQLPRTGVTAFCPTVLTSSAAYYHRVLADLRSDGRSRGGSHGGGRAQILGVHLDGPFISPRRAGAHPLRNVQAFVGEEGGEAGGGDGGSRTGGDAGSLAGGAAGGSKAVDAGAAGKTADAADAAAASSLAAPSAGGGSASFSLSPSYSLESLANEEDAAVLATGGAPFDKLKAVYGPNMEHVSIVTLAPELVGAQQVIRDLRRWGIHVSLGHSKCTLERGLEAVRGGASMLTHLFNAMPSFHHRDPSLVGVIASDLPAGREIHFGIIADGIHTHPAAVRMAYRIAPDALFLVTDGVAPLGLGSGSFRVNTRQVTVRADDPKSPTACKIADTDILCGSVSPMDACVRRLRKFTGCSAIYALETATLHPARALGIAEWKGTLDFGADADFLFLDPATLHVRATYIGGACAWSEEE